MVRTTRVMRLFTIVALIATLAVALAGCQPPRPGAQGPPPTPTSTVPSGAKVVWSGSYARNIQPIFDQKCVPCHGSTRAENGLRLDGYAGVMKGTQFGPVVEPGSPSRSTLVSVIRGTADPKIRMPHEGQRLTEQESQNIVLWIEAGAPSS